MFIPYRQRRPAGSRTPARARSHLSPRRTTTESSLYCCVKRVRRLTFWREKWKWLLPSTVNTIIHRQLHDMVQSQQWVLWRVWSRCLLMSRVCFVNFGFGVYFVGMSQNKNKGVDVKIIFDQIDEVSCGLNIARNEHSSSGIYLQGVLEFDPTSNLWQCRSCETW